MAKGGYTVGIEPWLQTPFWQQQGYSSYAEWQAAQGGSDTPASDSGQWSSVPVNMPQRGGTRSWQDSDNMWWQELQGVQHPVLWGQYETPKLTQSQGTVGTPQENILQTKKLTQDELGSYFWDVGNAAMDQAFHSSGVDQSETAATQNAIKSLATRQSLNNLQRLLTKQGNTRLKSLIDRYDLTGLQDKFNAFSKDVVSQGDLDSWQGDQEAKWGNWTNQQQQKIGNLSDKFNSQIGGLKDSLGDFQANNTAKWNQNASQWDNWNSQWEKASDKLNNTEKQTGLLSSMLNNTQGQLDSFSSSTNASLNKFNSQMAQAVQKQQAADAARGQLLSRLQKEEQIRQALAGKVSTNTSDIGSLQASQKAGFSGAEADRKGLSSMIERASGEWSKKLEEETRARAEAIKHVDSGWLDDFKNLEATTTDLSKNLTGQLGNLKNVWETQSSQFNTKLENTANQLRQADETTRTNFINNLKSNEAAWQETFGATKEEILTELNMTEEEFYSALTSQEGVIQSNWDKTLSEIGNLQNKWETGNAELSTRLKNTASQLQQADIQTRESFVSQLKSNEAAWQETFGATKEEILTELNMTEEEFYSALSSQGDTIESNWEATLNALTEQKTAWQTGNEALNQRLEAATDQLSQADEDTRDAFVTKLRESEATWQEAFGVTKDELLDKLNMTEEEFYSALGEQEEKIQSNWEATIEALTNQKNEFSNKVSDTQNDLISRLTDLGSVLTGKIDDSTTAWQTGNEALNQRLEAATDQLSQADEDTRDAFVAQLQESEASWQEAFGATKEEILNELNMTEEEFYNALNSQGDTIESNWEATLNALTEQKNESDKLAKEQKALEEQQKQQTMEQRKAALEQAGLWDHIQRLYASDEEGLKAFLLSGQLQNQTALSNWAGQQQQSVISDLNQQYATAVAQAQQALKAQGVTDSSVYRQAEDALRAQRGQILSAYRNAYTPSSLGALLSGSPEDIAAYQIPTSISNYGNGLSGFASLDPTLSQYVSGGVDEAPLAWLNNNSSAWNSAVTKQGSGGLLEAALRGYLGG